MMKDLLWAESQKLHRSKILWIAGFATVMVGLIVFAQGQFTFYDRRYIDGAGWFMTAAQSLATFYVLPAVIALLGSYMICREEQEDTLKSLRLIPVDSVFARSLTHCSPCINCQRIFIRVKSPIALCSSLSFSNSKAFGTSKVIFCGWLIIYLQSVKSCLTDKI